MLKGRAACVQRGIRAQSVYRRRSPEWGSRRLRLRRDALWTLSGLAGAGHSGKDVVDEAKAIVAERTHPQTEWKGPTTGPRAPAGGFTIAYVSPDQSFRRTCSGAKASSRARKPSAGKC